MPSLPPVSIVSGKYSPKGPLTEVNYIVETFWIGYIMLYIIPFCAIILVNLLILEGEQSIPIDVIVMLNFSMLFLFIPGLVSSIQGKKMEKIFIREMKIED